MGGYNKTKQILQQNYTAINWEIHEQAELAKATIKEDILINSVSEALKTIPPNTEEDK